MQPTKRYIVRNNKTGKSIDEFATLEEAEIALEECEAMDIRNGEFKVDSYEVYDSVTGLADAHQVYQFIAGSFVTDEEAIKYVAEHSRLNVQDYIDSNSKKL